MPLKYYIFSKPDMPRYKNLVFPLLATVILLISIVKNDGICDTCAKILCDVYEIYKEMQHFWG